MNAYFYWVAARKQEANCAGLKYLRISLRIMAILLIGLVLTPHTLVDPIHMAIGATLFSLQLLLSIWFLAKIDRSWQSIGLVLLEFFWGVASFYYLLKPHGLLLQGQLIFQIAFGVLLIRILNRAVDK